MTIFRLILKSFLHYFKANMFVMMGIAVSTAVLTGSFIIGDSVTFSLEQITRYRLGETRFSVSSPGRYFRTALASEIAGNSHLQIAPVLMSEGIAISEGGAKRANRVQVLGIDKLFEDISGTTIFSGLGRNEIVVSENLAQRLGVEVGDGILLRIKKESLIPLNAPFISDAETSVSFNARIKAIAGKKEAGYFSLKNSQSPPMNVFLSLGRLNELMGFQSKANTLLIAGQAEASGLSFWLKTCWQPEDAGLKFRKTGIPGETEIYSERVFLDPAISPVFIAEPGAQGILTYFANSIKKGESAEIPYSFVSSLPATQLGENEIILNRWAADDLHANIGDSARLAYYIVGPLRQLQEDSTAFCVKQIVEMNSRYADPSLMPFLPGLSDAGHCSDWEAGVPIDLGKIRNKDEEYWNVYKGTPKAFISITEALKIWPNRFGEYTAIRFDSVKFSSSDFERVFHEKINPADLGFIPVPVRENGLNAARNGTDFSQLFLGLSFFLLVAALLLSSLLVLLNFESRIQQVGTLSAIGFRQKQIRSILSFENLLVSLAGSMAGIVLAVVYTRLVFGALNTLWYDIVRTPLLEIKLKPLALLSGFFLSLAIAWITTVLLVGRKLKQQAAEIQKRVQHAEKKQVVRAKQVMAILLIAISFILIIIQLWRKETQNSSAFFLSGSLVLIAMLILSGQFFKVRTNKLKLSLAALSFRNLVQNKRRSQTIFFLLALGTFLVVSTGSNKKGFISEAENKKGGAGGFLYFAESSVPVLFDLNNPQKRAEEGLSGNYHIVQFSKMEGDDASCLNLNRISAPAVLGVNPEELFGRFSFVSTTSDLDKTNPWLSLNEELPGGVVPAIADQTAIQWGLGKKVGDTLIYRNETGDTLRLKLIGGLAASIFQGYVIVADKYFQKNYPSISGSSVFLVDGPSGKQQQAIAGELEFAFRDYGWEQTLAPQRLAEFYSVTNTYLSIFMALGALALLLGTVGLAIVLARSLISRKYEIALQMAVGFPARKIFRMILSEYSILLSSGIVCGLAAALLATFPSLISPDSGVSITAIGVMVLIILLNGLGWIAGLAWFSLKNKNLVVSLRNE